MSKTLFSETRKAQKKCLSKNLMFDVRKYVKIIEFLISQIQFFIFFAENQLENKTITFRFRFLNGFES